MTKYFPFRNIRQLSLDYWLKETGRQRFNRNEIFSGAFECRWQFRFLTEPQVSDPHISVFCSMGEWNSNIGDLLGDDHFDGLTFHSSNADVLFRYYTKVLLIASEILTDFQDILTIFRNGNIDSVKKWGENEKSRNELNLHSIPDAMQNLIDYINTHLQTQN